MEKVTSGGEGFFCVRQGREAMCRLKKFEDSFNSILTKMTPVSKGSTLFKSALSYLVFADRVQTLAQMVNDIKKIMTIDIGLSAFIHRGNNLLQIVAPLHMTRTHHPC